MKVSNCNNKTLQSCGERHTQYLEVDLIQNLSRLLSDRKKCEVEIFCEGV